MMGKKFYEKLRQIILKCYRFSLQPFIFFQICAQLSSLLRPLKEVKIWDAQNQHEITKKVIIQPLAVLFKPFSDIVIYIWFEVFF